jgi:hypothetical protein
MAYVAEMRKFKEDTGAEGCVALDGFLGYWYVTHQKAKATSNY